MTRSAREIDASGNGHARVARDAGRALLVTGTDTGVGKTAVACALATEARESGVAVTAFKPFETGVSRGRRAGNDAAALARASGQTPTEVAGICLADPLAPAIAAERAGIRVSVRGQQRHFERLRKESDLVIVEGAGGVMVPIEWDQTFVDLAESWGLDALVVARAGLGTINHVMLTIDALRQRGVTVRAVVLNRRRARPDLAEQTNPGALARFLPGMPLFVLPEVRGKGASSVASALRRAKRSAWRRLLKACLEEPT